MARDTTAVLRRLRVLGVGVAACVGGGLLYVPRGVAETAGPLSPLSYLLAGAAAVAVAAAYAVLAAAFPGDGVVYRAVSRTWGSRRLGVLASWPSLAAYVALVALLADWLGHLAPLPATAGSYLYESMAVPPVLVDLLGVAPTPALADGVAVAVCVAGWLAHAVGRRRAVSVVAAVAVGVVAALTLGLLAAFVPGVGEFTLRSFEPVLPTADLRADPVGRLVAGAGAAVFAFVGVEAAAHAAAAVTATPEATDGNPAGGATTGTAATGVVAAAGVVAVVVTLTATVALGVIPWVRLTLADVPAADAMAAYLPVDPVALTGAVSVLAAGAGVVALSVPAGRTLAGYAELYPPLGRGPSDPPVVSLGVVYAVAAALCLVDVTGAALYLAVPGIAVAALAVAVTAAALPWLRPDRLPAVPWLRSRRRHVGLGAVAVPVAGWLFVAALTLDPATTLGRTLHSVTLAQFDFELVADTAVTVALWFAVWEFVGVVATFVLDDYRDAGGVDLPPLRAAPGGADTGADPDEDSDSAAEADTDAAVGADSGGADGTGEPR
ncbi:hypothetical protein [Halobaculum sp. P14]|uniref:hypothetical protein n=1 Tax=Halobaculum sp. P14 TaxID=3421638 RepID=UPI003EB6F628